MFRFSFTKFCPQYRLIWQKYTSKHSSTVIIEVSSNNYINLAASWSNKYMIFNLFCPISMKVIYYSIC